jgi:predicted pyridoxine 5'-phosphate oxidase superfamily flavin-nucleotide-binding protein
MSEQQVDTLEQLRAVDPAPGDRVLRKKQDRLDGHCRRFIALSPFVLVSTASAAGACDASPKGGPPGFVRVLDSHRLLVPDASGNRIACAATGGRAAEVGIVVEVQEAYLHCAKALIRSDLWDPASWPDADELPSAARIFSDHGGVGDVAAVQQAIADSYATDL